MTETAEDGPGSEALFTDLYELTMAQAYYAEGMNDLAVFELFFREMPAARNFIITAGLADVLDYLENWRFTSEDLTYLARQGTFRRDFLDWLESIRFTGDVRAVPEGTIIFENEPVFQITAPIIEAQILETVIINQFHFQSITASKAARVVLAAGGRGVMDFGSRRAHGSDAAIKAARTSYLAGAAGTSNVLAGKRYGLPIMGTMAHSYIQAHQLEEQAFTAFVSLYPDTTLLVDTYDTLTGVARVIELSRESQGRLNIGAIRLDSGDLAGLAVQARRMLDEAGLNRVKIIASGGLDEYKIADLIQRGAPVDGFGVGTRMVVSPDAVDLDMAYKLVEYAGLHKTKLSSKKVIYPGRKQIFRNMEDGRMASDIVGAFDEHLPGKKLLVPVMEGGRRLPAGRETLKQVRDRAKLEIERLPVRLLALEKAEHPYPVQISDRLKNELAKVEQCMRG